LLRDNNPNEQEVAAFFCDKLSTGRGSTLSFARTNPIFMAGARPKWRPVTVTRFRWNTGAAPKQAHRMRAVDAEFIGSLTLIDRFPPTAPDRFCQVRGAFTPFSPEIVSRLGNWYDCSGLYIRGVDRGELGECAGASAAITCPAASISIRLLSPGISGFPGKRSQSLRRNAKMRSRRYRCYSCSKSRCRSADVRLLKSRDCIGRKCGLRFGIPRASQQIRHSF
jgi:hypothetical protein